MVGLGNPGSQYDQTRHNIGFSVVDALRACSGSLDLAEVEKSAHKQALSALAGDLGVSGWSERAGFREASITLPGWNVSLIKPMTFMNRSGEPLQSFLSYKKIPINQVIVVHDEIDIPFGVVRVKVDGGEGGHNGLRSISERCGGRGYARVRVGVGKPPPESPWSGRPDGVAGWVLSKFSSDERSQAQELVVRW